MKVVKEIKDGSDFLKNLHNKKYSIQFLPKKLDLESKSKNISYKSKILKTAYLVDITHNLILKYYFKKENSFNLSSIVLKDKYGYLYNFYIDYLVEKQILILTKKHMKGKNARIYKLNDDVTLSTPLPCNVLKLSVKSPILPSVSLIA